MKYSKHMNQRFTPITSVMATFFKRMSAKKLFQRITKDYKEKLFEWNKMHNESFPNKIRDRKCIQKKV